MIDLKQAAQIATKYQNDDEIVGASFNDSMFVFVFQPRSGHYANLPIAVDRQTGDVRSLGASEYVKISDTLQEVT